MKRIALLAVLCATVLTMLSGCHSSVEESKISDYGAWNNTTKQILTDKFNAVLPTVSEVSQSGQEYRYTYDQSLLGDPNFVIHVKLKFSDETALSQHIEEKALEQFVSVKTQEGQCFLRQGTVDLVTEYTNDKTYDGYFFCFDLMQVDDKEFEVDYWVAYVWDYWKDDELTGVLRLIQPEK